MAGEVEQNVDAIAMHLARCGFIAQTGDDVPGSKMRLETGGDRVLARARRIGHQFEPGRIVVHQETFQETCDRMRAQVPGNQSQPQARALSCHRNAPSGIRPGLRQHLFAVAFGLR